MRFLTCLFLFLALAGCSRPDEARMPDPAANGGGIVGGEPGGSPYAKPAR